MYAVVIFIDCTVGLVKTWGVVSSHQGKRAISAHSLFTEADNSVYFDQKTRAAAQSPCGGENPNGSSHFNIDRVGVMGRYFKGEMKYKINEEMKILNIRLKE